VSISVMHSLFYTQRPSQPSRPPALPSLQGRLLRYCTWAVQKMTQPIAMPFGLLWTRVGPSGPKHVRSRFHAKGQFLGERTYPGMPEDYHQLYTHGWTNRGIEMEVEIPLCEGAVLGERACQGMTDDCRVSCAKMAAPIELPFGLWRRVGQRKHV